MAQMTIFLHSNDKSKQAGFFFFSPSCPALLNLSALTSA